MQMAASQLVSAAKWVAGVITEKVLTSKLEEWASRFFGLGGDINDLKVQMSYVQMVLSMAQGRRIRNAHLTNLLARLHLLLHEADDALDELEYHRLQHEVERREPPHVATTPMLNASLTAMATSAFQLLSDVASHQPLASSVFRDMLLFPWDRNKRRKLSHHTVDASSSAQPRLGLNRISFSERIREVTDKLRNDSEKVREALQLEDLESISLAVHNRPENPRLTTSYPAGELKIFGRDDQRDSIIQVLTNNRCHNQNTLSVLSIVGNGGLGKTTLLQHVCHDQRVRSFFHIRMWICVSRPFDVVRLTHEMLEAATGEKQHRGSENLDTLQAKLEERLQGRRFLLVFDDLWALDKSKWDLLLAPLRWIEATGNGTILVTTRDRRIAEQISTSPPIDLSGLEGEAFWACFRAYIFGDEKHHGHQHLQPIGKKIARKLNGYPLAAKSVGALLRQELSIEHWSRILESRAWEPQNGTGGIMSILRLSYEHLPFHLQRCFSYCSLFPKGHRFRARDLVLIWVSQGFVDPRNGMRTEGVGHEYLNDLVSLGFFEKVVEPSYTWYLMHDLVHDLAMNVSSNYCFTIDRFSKFNLRPSATICHLSIILESIYHEDRCGNKSCNEDIEKLVAEIASLLQMRYLRSLMLFGKYDSSFVQVFRRAFKEATNIRSIILSTLPYHEVPLLCDLGQCIHLRYIRIIADDHLYIPEALCGLHHLEVLDVGECIVDLPRNVYDLTKLRYLLAPPEMHSNIANVQRLNSLQELQQFEVGREEDFKISQLGDLLDLQGWLSIYNLEHVSTKIEAEEAKLSVKSGLSGLSLCWNEQTTCCTTADAEQTLQGLQPPPTIRHLSINGYSGAATPTWLANHSVSSLRCLYLENCKGWKILPAFGQFPVLKKLHLIGMPAITELQTASLVEVIIYNMPELQTWIVTEKHQLIDDLQVLKICDCPKLRDLPLPSSSDSDAVNYHRLQRVVIKNCSCLMPLPPLPLGPKIKLSVENVPSFPCMRISYSADTDPCLLLKGIKELTVLDGCVLSFEHLTLLQQLSLDSCPSLVGFSWEGFHRFSALKDLTIYECPKLLSMPMTQVEQEFAKHLLPSLESLEISSCGITGKNLSCLLLHLQHLSFLKLQECAEIKGLVVVQQEDHGNSIFLSNGVAGDSFLHIRPSFLPSLRELCFDTCPTVCETSEGLRGLVTLEKLEIYECQRFLSHVHVEGTCLFPSSLQELKISSAECEFLSLHGLTAIERLSIRHSRLEALDLETCVELKYIDVLCCPALSYIQGLRCCTQLRRLEVLLTPGFWRAWDLALQGEGAGDELSFPVDLVHTNDTSILTISICKQLNHLRRLEFYALSNKLEVEQEQALEQLTSLNEIRFSECNDNFSLPAELQQLTSLKKLEIMDCSTISSFSERGLPSALEHLVVVGCKHLKSLPEGMHGLAFLKKLEIKNCPKIESLPEGGLPASLKELRLKKYSSMLKQQLQEMGNTDMVICWL